MALRHYNVYLDDQNPADQLMIALLEPAAKKRRAGEVLRRALDLLVHYQQPALAPIPAPVLAYAPTPQPPPTKPIASTPPTPPMPPASINSAVAKARSSFMRR